MKINRPKIAHPDTLLPGMQGAFLTSPFLNDDVNHLYTPRVQKYISMYHLDIGSTTSTLEILDALTTTRKSQWSPSRNWSFQKLCGHFIR